MQDTIFNLKIASREGVIFEGKASSITSYNSKGKFDVLAQHANFISLLQKSVQIIDISGNTKEVKFDNALMKVYQNQVSIYMGIEWLISANTLSAATSN